MRLHGADDTLTRYHLKEGQRKRVTGDIGKLAQNLTAEKAIYEKMWSNVSAATSSTENRRTPDLVVATDRLAGICAAAPGHLIKVAKPTTEKTGPVKMHDWVLSILPRATLWKYPTVQEWSDEELASAAACCRDLHDAGRLFVVIFPSSLGTAPRRRPLRSSATTTPATTRGRTSAGSPTPSTSTTSSRGALRQAPPPTRLRRKGCSRDCVPNSARPGTCGSWPPRRGPRPRAGW